MFVARFGCSKLSLLGANDRGVTAVAMALSMTVILGFAGLGVDYAAWETSKRNMQGAADQAAYSAAVAASSTAGRPVITGKAITAQMGFVDSQDSIVVSINNPPTQGRYRTNHHAWEAMITKPQRMWFSNLFLPSDPIATARATALAAIQGQFCILALEPSASSSFAVQGSAHVEAPQCNIQVNSANSSAATWSGSATIQANTLAVTGGYSGSAGQITGTIDAPAPTIADPYVNVAVPAFSGCGGGNNRSINSVVTIQPGVYCNGLTLNSNAVVTMNPGTYIIDRGVFRINGGARVTGVGVTIILTSSTGANYATMTINGSAVVNLTAQTSGSLSGLVVFQDRAAPSSTTNTLNGGSGQTLVGALYFPNTQVNYGGGAVSGSPTSLCTQLIARTISLTGDSGFRTDCTGIGTMSMAGTGSAMAE